MISGCGRRRHDLATAAPMQRRPAVLRGGRTDRQTNSAITVSLEPQLGQSRFVAQIEARIE